MPAVDPIILELRAQLTQYKNELRATTTIVDRSLQQQERRVISLERQIERSSNEIGGRLRLLAGAFAGAFSANQVKGLIDGFTRVQNALKVAGLEGAQLERVQSQLLDLSSEYGVSLESLASLFGNATQAGKELGASQGQVLALTRATSQALLITGTSAQSASGAILGLQQALASGTVRAEEFNQINEGGLRPLLQAAANAERFGGSVAKLRQAVIDGTVSSQELLTFILRFSDALEGQASKATLTLSGAFEALNSRLIDYVGRSAEANGISGALAGGIKLLADNVESVANALAIVSAVLLGRFAAGAFAGGRALQALSAYASIATTSLAGTALAARGAGAALLAALGGAPALAIAAIALALGYAATQANEFERAQIAQAKGAARATEASKGAQQAIDRLATATGAARTEALDFANAQREVQGQLLKTAAAAVVAAQAQRRAAEAEGPQSSLGLVGDVARTVLNRNNVAARGERLITADNAENEAYGEFKELANLYRSLTSSIDNGPPVNAAAAGKPDKTEKSRAAADNAQRNLDRFDDDLARLQATELQLKSELATDTAERAEFERQLIDLARQEYDTELTRRVRDGELTEQQAQRLRIGNRFNAQLEQDISDREKRDRDLDKRDAALRDEIRTAEASAELLTNREDRLAAERRILALVEQEERNALERAIADGQVLDAAKAEANLKAQQASRRTATDRQFESPLQRYRRESAEVGNNINDAIEGVAVDGLDALNEGIVDAITGAKSLGDAFGNVANQIIKDLLRIAIQRQVIGPLADSLFGAEGGGGGQVGGFLRSIFGRASGGYAGPGQMVRVNEGASPGRVEGFMPNGGGQIIPLGRMNALSPQQAGGGTSTIRLELSGDIDARMVKVAEGVSVEVVRASAEPIANAAMYKTIGELTKRTM